jgi:hypothetical protein
MMCVFLLSNMYAVAFGGPNYDAGLAIAPSGDGGFVVAGQTYGVGAGDYDICAVKVTPTGAIAWARTFGGTGWEAPGAIIRTSDGGFLIVGGTGSWGAGAYDILVLKITSTGGFSWARVFGGSSYEMAYDVIELSDGFAVAGYTSSTGAGESDFLLLRLGTSGGLSWARVFGTSLDETAFGVAQTSDGGFVVVGEREISGTDWDALVVKYTSTGTLSWARSVSAGTMPERACKVIPTAGDSLAIGGFTLNSATGYYMMLLFKMSSAGAVGWGRAYGGSGTTYGYDLIPSGSDFILSGETRASGAGGFDYAMMKVSSSGVLQWARTWGTSNVDDGQLVALGTDGIGMVGWTYGIGSGGDILLLKTDMNGNYPSCVLNWSPSTVSPTLTATALSGGTSWSPTNSSVTPTSTAPSWTPTNACTPVGIDEEGSDDCEIWASGNAIYVRSLRSQHAEIGLYLPDGRLEEVVFSGWLTSGVSRFELPSGRGLRFGVVRFGERARTAKAVILGR